MDEDLCFDENQRTVCKSARVKGWLEEIVAYARIKTGGDRP
jgi:hypothetical protein